MENLILLDPYRLGKLNLKNRIVMAPMTRSRALGNVPNELMALYYHQRAGAGLLITEGTSPSPNGLGYENMPGIFSPEQIKGWQKITNSVHAKGAKIVVQLLHTGRIAHTDNLPEGAKVLSASPIPAKGQIHTAHGLKSYPTPHEMTEEEIQQTMQEFVEAAKNAIEAGFDGVEIHAGHGYLIEQFLHPATNRRTDEYGGSLENRAKFLLDLTRKVSLSIGKEKVGVHFAPFSLLNDLPLQDKLEETYGYLAKQLEKLEILYLHIDQSKSLGVDTPPFLLENLRLSFDGSFLLGGGYSKNQAEADIISDKADLIVFGKAFISHPDLVERIENNWPMDQKIQYVYLYSSGEEGYIDYPSYSEETMYV
jgi:N-ethylmaleimide reductase